MTQLEPRIEGSLNPYSLTDTARLELKLSREFIIIKKNDSPRVVSTAVNWQGNISHILGWDSNTQL